MKKTKAKMALAARASLLRYIVNEATEATRFIHSPELQLAAFEKVITVLLDLHFPSVEAPAAPLSRRPPAGQGKGK
jgi:hypothetical protein